MTLTVKKIKEDAFRESYLYDFYSTKLLADEALKDYLILIIAKALEKDVESIEKDFNYVDIRLGLSRKNVDSIADLVVKTGIGYISIEINWRMSRINIVKAMLYVCELLLRQVETAEDYGKIEDVYQININREDIYGKGKFVYRSDLRERTMNIARKYNILQITDINMEFLKKMKYTTIKEMEQDDLERLFYILSNSNHRELDEVYEGDELMSKVKKKLYDLESELDRLLIYDRQKMIVDNINDYLYEIGQKEGREQGLEQGREEGREEGKNEERAKLLESIKKMYNNGIPMKKILECFDLSEKEKKSIKQ